MEITKELIRRFIENATTVEENDAMAAWIESSEENERIFGEEVKMHLAMLNVAAVQEDIAVERTKRRRVLQIVSYTAGIAASAAIGFFLSFQFFAKPANELIDNTMLVSESLPGQRTDVTLSDGTVVNLNSDTKIEYPAIFSGDERRVRVSGEAMFDVSHNPEKPFIVETFVYDIKVLGTKFDVIADESENEFVTSLLEGKVAILDKENRRIADLEPNETVELRDGRLLKTQEDDLDEEHLWTAGVISVTDVPFDKLMMKFERCFGVDIEIRGGKIPEIRYAFLKISVNDGIERAFEILKRRTEFEYTFDELNNTYIIDTDL